MFDGGRVDYLADVRHSRIHDRRSGVYSYYLGGVPNLQRGIQCRPLGNKQLDIRHDERPKARHGKRNRIVRSLETGDDVLTLRIRGRFLLDARSQVLYRYRAAGDPRSGCIRESAHDRCTGSLRAYYGGGTNQQERRHCDSHQRLE